MTNHCYFILLLFCLHVLEHCLSTPMKDVGLQVIIDYLIPFKLKKEQTVTQEGKREMAFL